MTPTDFDRRNPVFHPHSDRSGRWLRLGRRIYCPRLRMAHSFNRVGNAPREGKQAGERCSRGPLGTRLNEPMPTACGITPSPRYSGERVGVRGGKANAEVIFRSSLGTRGIRVINTPVPTRAAGCPPQKLHHVRSPRLRQIPFDFFGIVEAPSAPVVDVVRAFQGDPLPGGRHGDPIICRESGPFVL